jgi:hypothetical protein
VDGNRRSASWLRWPWRRPREEAGSPPAAGQPDPVRRALVIHGVEDQDSRALFVVAALYHCADRLAGRPVRFVGVEDVSVEIAARVLAYDTGLEVQLVPARGEMAAEVFRDAALFVGVALQDTCCIPTELPRRYGVPTLVAAQFPPLTQMHAAALAMLADSQCPARFARLLLGRLDVAAGS